MYLSKRIAMWPAAPAAVLVLLCSACPPALAGPSPDAGDAGQLVCSAQDHAPPPAHTDVVGTYRLSNGGLLRVRREVSRYVAELGGIGRIEILPLGEDSFAEKGGPLRFAFSHDAFDDSVVITGLDLPRPGAQLCPG